MSTRPIGFILGFLILVFAGAMLAPLFVSLATEDGEWPAFAAGIGTCLFVGGMLILTLRSDRIELGRRQGFALTSTVWVCLPLFGALPFVWSDRVGTFTDAVFESVSGITTTGSTVLAGLDLMEPSLLLWRSLLQWLGGIGIIAMGIVILPFLRVGGMQIFRTESSDRSDKVVARASDFMVMLVGVYVGLSLLCAGAYALAGMTVFEAVNHAMTTISTGGYSTSDLSMGYFESAAIQWIGTFFMLAGGIPFALYIFALRGKPGRLFRNSQVLTFLSFVLAVSLGLAVYLMVTRDTSLPLALRLTAFNVTSVVTTTGYATSDYTAWGGFAGVVFYFLIFLGACSGSTSGGFKVYRVQIIYELVRTTIRRMTMPHGVFIPRYAGKEIDAEVTYSVAAFMVLFVTTILVIALALAMIGLDFETAFSGAATAVANVGPGVGDVIGPAGNFSSLPDVAKWILSAGMILGRLEIVTLAVLALPEYWRA